MSIEETTKPKAYQFDNASRRLVIDWCDSHQSTFPYIWLRHHQSYPLTGRPEQGPDYVFLAPEASQGLLVSKLDRRDDELVIQWQHDTSTTHHKFTELRSRCLSQLARQSRQPNHTIWLAKNAHEFPWFAASDFENPERRMEVFLHVRDYGIALVKNLSPNEKKIESLLPYFGPARHTHFGYLFDIRSRPNDNDGTGANIGATASNAQSPHSDEGWRHGPPGISLFHCLKSSPNGGGSSVFVDAIGAAESLRTSHPDSFHFLSTTPILFEAQRNAEERFRARNRIIATDMDGNVRGVRVTDRTIPPLDLAADKIEMGYQALSDFYGILASPERRFEYLLKPGEMVIFDNHQTLHARHEFDPQAGERWLQQLSIDREEFHNRLRQLADQLGREDISNWEPDAGCLSYGVS